MDRTGRRAVSRLVAVALLVLVAGACLAPPASAQIIETRQGDANPMVSVFKSTIYGGLAGLVVGLAIAVASDDNDDGDAIRWGFVGGTFLGLGYGIYDVATRPSPGRALLEGGAGGWSVGVPTLAFAGAVTDPRTARALERVGEPAGPAWRVPVLARRF
jgi:hypothetical protein